MSATERPSLLNDIEALSRELDSARPTARAIEALETYAESVDMPAGEAERLAEQIREMEPRRLKRVRKSLMAAAELSVLLDMAVADSADPVDVFVEPLAEEVATEVALPQVVEAPVQVAEAEPVPADVASHEEISPEGLDSPEKAASDLSESGKKWVLRLVPEFDFIDKRTRQEKTARQVANDLYKRMGEPKTRTFDGKKIDPLLRLRRRLRGESNTDIATQEGVSRQSVANWFINFVGSRFQATATVDETDRPVDATEQVTTEIESGPTAAGDTTSLPEPEVEQPPVRPVATPMNVRFRQPVPAIAESIIDATSLAEYWAAEMNLDGNDTELLTQALDPGYALDLSGSHRSKLHHFRQFMEKRLPKLEDSDLDLTTNEIARLSRLLGRTESHGEYSFTAKPQSAREVSMVDGYIVPQQRSELLSGLDKLHRYMLQGPATDETEAVVSQFKQVLAEAGFSDELVAGLEAVIGLREDTSADINEATKSLQGLFVDNSRKLDPEQDHELMASLRMLTNTAMGRKTVRDVYHRLHGKDSSVTRESVTQMLESGIIKLAM